MLIRLVTSAATRGDEIDRFVELCRKGVTVPPQQPQSAAEACGEGSNVGGKAVKQRYALAVLAAVTVATPASAQQVVASDALPPHEILTHRALGGL